MPRHIVNIPAICPSHVHPDSLGSYVSSQPIIQLKELEPDRVRYDQWKAMLTYKRKKKKEKIKPPV